MGDSGGPLIRPFYGPTQGGQALDTVIGVLSYGPVSQISLGDKTNGQQLCGDPNRPDAYTRIGPYRAWIDTTIAGSGETASNFLSPIMDLFANLGKVKDAGPEAGNTAGGMNEQGESIDGDLEMVASAANAGESIDDDYNEPGGDSVVAAGGPTGSYARRRLRATASAHRRRLAETAEPKVCTVESVVNAKKCSTYAVDGLSKQIIAQMNFDNPGVFVEVPGVAPCAVDEDGKDIECGGTKATAGKRTKGVKCTKACIPYMQPRAAETLYNATIAIGDSLTGTSMFRSSASSSSAAVVRARPDAPRLVRQPEEGQQMQEEAWRQVRSRGERPPHLRHPALQKPARRTTSTASRSTCPVPPHGGEGEEPRRPRLQVVRLATRCTSRTTARAASTTAARTSAPSRSSGTPTTRTRSGTRRRGRGSSPNRARRTTPNKMQLLGDEGEACTFSG